MIAGQRHHVKQIKWSDSRKAAKMNQMKIEEVVMPLCTSYLDRRNTLRYTTQSGLPRSAYHQAFWSEKLGPGDTLGSFWLHSLWLLFERDDLVRLVEFNQVVLFRHPHLKLQDLKLFLQIVITCSVANRATTTASGVRNAPKHKVVELS